jgi:hypothetical protein
MATPFDGRRHSPNVRANARLFGAIQDGGRLRSSPRRRPRWDHYRRRCAFCMPGRAHPSSAIASSSGGRIVSRAVGADRFGMERAARFRPAPGPELAGEAASVPAIALRSALHDRSWQVQVGSQYVHSKIKRWRDPGSGDATFDLSAVRCHDTMREAGHDVPHSAQGHPSIC